MFQPFENSAQFHPGLIVRCDPNCYEMNVSTLPPNTAYDRKKARELRPCLVVAVNHTTQEIQVARLCATMPTDTRRWVRVDTPPAITWKLNDAWLWVGTPPTLAMVFNAPKTMHLPSGSNYPTSPSTYSTTKVLFSLHQRKATFPSTQQAVAVVISPHQSRTHTVMAKQRRQVVSTPSRRNLSSSPRALPRRMLVHPAGGATLLRDGFGTRLGDCSLQPP
ncbi:hypothetical protein C8R43DRAFT_1193354 [Mycena crocata]|nr:hypothetical protein C8R43DRAFT_1193354 [Mycena crocata]